MQSSATDPASQLTSWLSLMMATGCPVPDVNPRIPSQLWGVSSTAITSPACWGCSWHSLLQVTSYCYSLLNDPGATGDGDSSEEAVCNGISSAKEWQWQECCTKDWVLVQRYLRRHLPRLIFWGILAFRAQRGAVMHLVYLGVMLSSSSKLPGQRAWSNGYAISALWLFHFWWAFLFLFLPKLIGFALLL